MSTRIFCFTTKKMSATLTFWAAVMLCLTLASSAAAASYTVTITGDGTNSVGAGSYAAGATVSVNAGHHPKGLPFRVWSSQDDSVKFSDAYSGKTSFVMPERDVTVEAVFGGLGKKLADAMPNPFVDIRDNNSYKWITIGDRKWMAENLKYDIEGSSWCGGDDANCDKGRFYRWTTAMGISADYNSAVWNSDNGNINQQGICPAGWHIPQAADWAALAKVKNAATPATAAAYLRAKGAWGTATSYDEVGFTALPAGRYNVTTGVTDSAATLARWWLNVNTGTGTNAYSATLTGSTSSFGTTAVNRATYAYQVRCVAYVESYEVVVEGGSGGGVKEPGKTVTITAGAAPDGMKFKRWTVEKGGVKIASLYSATTSFIMPEDSVRVKANYMPAFEDKRDGKVYGTVEIAGLTWMAENLNYEPKEGKNNSWNSYCYGDTAEYCDKYGRMYDWATAMDEVDSYNSTRWEGNGFQHQGICPTGWHMPNNVEWMALAKVIESGSGTTMTYAQNKISAVGEWGSSMSPTDSKTDSTGFSALPGGGYYVSSSKYQYNDRGSRAYWWRTDQTTNTNTAYYFYIGYAMNYISGNNRKTDRYSVRCIADYKVVIKNPVVKNTALVYTGSEKSAGIDTNSAYIVTLDKAINAGKYTAIVSLKDKRSYVWEDSKDTADLELDWEIAKAAGTFVPAELNVTYTSTLKLSDLTGALGELTEGYDSTYYIWDTLQTDTTVRLYAEDGQEFAVFYTPDSNHTTRPGVITVNVSKAEGLTVTPPAIQVIPRDKTEARTFDLSEIELNPTDHSGGGGALVYTLMNVTDSDGSGGKILSGVPTLSGGKILNYQGRGAKEGIATQVVKITSKNYDDVYVTVVFQATDQVTYAVTVIDGTPGKTAYPEGDTVIVTARAAAPGEKFEKWTAAAAGLKFVDDDSVATTAMFIMPKGAVTVKANYVDVSHTIVFNPGAGGAVSPEFAKTGAGGKLDTLPVPTRTGYVFTGWYPSEESISRVDKNTEFTANAELYARWAAESYAVTWKTNGGAPVPTQTVVAYTGKIVEPEALTKTGYTFGGWYRDSLFAKAASFPIENVAEDITLYAKWSKNVYNVLWHNGGLPTVTSYAHGDSIKTGRAEGTKAGHVFDGWAVDYTLTSLAVFPLEVVSEMNLYAKWTPIYTITFNANGGSVTPASAATGAGGKLASLPTPTRSGYAFDGWYLATTGGTKLTENFPFSGSVTIYARWTSSGYTVTFDPNGGEVTPASGIAGADGKLTSLPTPTRPNHKFDGWFTSASGGTEVTASKVYEANTTIHAHWTLTTYTITFNPNGGTVTPTTALIGTDGKVSLLPTPTLNGNYHFDGWYTLPTGGEKVTAATTFGANATVYARWIQLYLVTFNAGEGGTVSPAYDQTGADGKLASLPTPAKTGSSFNGWYTSASGGTKVTTGTVFTVNTVVYAQWGIIGVTYTVTFNANGGTVSPATRATGSDGTLPSLPTPARSGYTFAGWYKATTGGDEVTENTVFAANTTIYARWTAVYTVTFNPNSGTVSPTSASVGADGTVASLPTPKRAGYKFDGWYTATTGGIEIMADHVFTANTTVYARWTAVTYTITFDPNGGAATTTSATTGTGGRLASLPTTANAGYVFEGWYTEPSDGVKVTTSTAFEGDATIYARWSLICVITFDPYGGTVTTATAKTGSGGKLASLPTPALKDYTFVGWYTAEEGGTRITTATVFEEDAVVFARWSLLSNAAVTYSAGANGTLRATVDGVPISTGASVGIGKDVIFTAVPNEGYKVARWTINGADMVDTVSTYVHAGLSNTASVSVTFERRVSIASPNREIPVGATNDVAVITPVKAVSGGLTLGPNPVRAGSDVAVFWTGGKAVKGSLSVFNAVGGKVAVVDVEGVNKIGTWRVGDIAEGTYLIRGVLTDKNGVKAVVSLLVGVVR